MDINEQRQLPALLRRLVDAKGVSVLEAEGAITTFRNWIYGRAVPNAERLPEIRRYFGLPAPAPSENDELSQAALHDRNLRTFKGEYKVAGKMRSDMEAYPAFGKAFSRCVDSWRQSHAQMTDVRMEHVLGVIKQTYLAHRSGQTVPKLDGLRNIIEKLALTPEQARPLIDTAFKAHRYGAYEPLEDVLRDLATAQDKGKLLKRLRLANLRSPLEISKELGITEPLIHAYEAGENYEQHATKLAKLFVPEASRVEFVQAVRRMHGTRTLDEIFLNLDGYDSMYALLSDLGNTQNVPMREIYRAGRITHGKILPRSREQIEGMGQVLRLQQEQTGMFVDFIEGLRNKHDYYLSPERFERVGRAENLAGFFDGLERYGHFGQMMRDLREICHLSLEDVGKRFGSTPCTRANISLLELKSEPPVPEVLRRWLAAYALGTEKETQVKQLACKLSPVDYRCAELGNAMNRYMAKHDMRFENLGDKLAISAYRQLQKERSVEESSINGMLAALGFSSADALIGEVSKPEYAPDLSTLRGR